MFLSNMISLVNIHHFFVWNPDAKSPSRQRHASLQGAGAGLWESTFDSNDAMDEIYWLVVWNMAEIFCPIVGMMIQSDYAGEI